MAPTKQCSSTRTGSRSKEPSRTCGGGSGDRLKTPSLDLGILAGVTRATLIELAPACGYRVEEGAYPLGDLLEADEAFTSSSVREVMPLVEIDGRDLGRGPAADALQQALRTLAAKV